MRRLKSAIAAFPAMFGSVAYLACMPESVDRIAGLTELRSPCARTNATRASICVWERGAVGAAFETTVYLEASSRSLGTAMIYSLQIIQKHTCDAACTT